MKKKYIFYFILSIVFLVLWAVAYICGWTMLNNNKVSMVLLSSFIFLFLILTQLLLGKIVDLKSKEIKKIWWSRVFILLAIALSVAFIIISRDSSIIVNIKALTNTAAFGLILGYFIARLDEGRKSKEEGRRLINALLYEISNSRFKCDSIIKRHPPTYFETYIWDGLRVSEHFKLLWNTKDLTNKLFNLYLFYGGANWRINILNIATTNKLVNPKSEEAQKVVQNANNNLVNFLEKELKDKIEEAQTALQVLCSSL